MDILINVLQTIWAVSLFVFLATTILPRFEFKIGKTEFTSK